MAETSDNSSFKDIICVEKLGENQQCCTFKAHYKNQPQPCFVLKKYLPSHWLWAYLQNTNLKEMKTDGSNHVVPVADCRVAPEQISILFEFADKGNLEVFLKHRHMNFVKIIKMFEQCAKSLQALHLTTPGAIHGNLKPENILLFKSSGKIVVKLSDFVPKDYTSEEMPTHDFHSPEHLQNKKLTPQSDIFSLGLIFFTSVNFAGFDYKLTPFQGPFAEYLLECKEGKRSPDPLAKNSVEDPQSVSEMKKLINHMTQENPASRPSLKDVIKKLKNITQDLPSANNSSGQTAKPASSKPKPEESGRWSTLQNADVPKHSPLCSQTSNTQTLGEKEKKWTLPCKSPADMGKMLGRLAFKLTNQKKAITQQSSGNNTSQDSPSKDSRGINLLAAEVSQSSTLSCAQPEKSNLHKVQTKNVSPTPVDKTIALTKHEKAIPIQKQICGEFFKALKITPTTRTFLRKSQTSSSGPTFVVTKTYLGNHFQWAKIQPLDLEKLKQIFKKNQTVCILLHSFAITEEKLTLNLEYVDKGDFESYMIQRHPSTDKILKIFMECLKSLLVLHQQVPVVIHGNLKPQNIFLITKKTGKVGIKFSDLNIGNLLNKNLFEKVNLHPYCTPEYITEQKLTKATDVFAMGLLLWSALSFTPGDHKMPLPGIILGDSEQLSCAEFLCKCYQNGKCESKEQVLNLVTLSQPTRSKLEKIVDKMMTYQPSARPTAEEVLSAMKEIRNLPKDNFRSLDSSSTGEDSSGTSSSKSAAVEKYEKSSSASDHTSQHKGIVNETVGKKPVPSEYKLASSSSNSKINTTEQSLVDTTPNKDRQGGKNLMEETTVSQMNNLLDLGVPLISLECTNASAAYQDFLKNKKRDTPLL